MRGQHKTPIRDLVGDGKQGGHMLEAATIIGIPTATSVTMGFPSGPVYVKAIVNEIRTPFFSFSDSDERTIVAYAQTMWDSGIRQIERGLIRRRAA